jgi:8-oxo-dGTP pyrophosphatase MutT (NUDIX family)
MRKVVSGIAIRDNDYLLVRKNRTYLFPGGKPEPHESDEDCLRREIREELSGTQIKNIRPYRVFEGQSPHKQDQVEVHYYFMDIEGELGRPSGEIDDAVWADRQDSFAVSEAAQKAIDALVRERLI